MESDAPVARRALVSPHPPAVRRFAALAVEASADGRSEDRSAVGSTLWLAAGQASWDAAIAAAMQPCENALGAGRCRWITASGQAVMVFYRDEARRAGGFRLNLSAQQALADVERLCHETGERCEIVAIHPAAEAVVRELDLIALPGVPLDQQRP